MSTDAGIGTKRIYDDPDPADGRRILVDRIWPRGVSREAAALDQWCPEVAPSHELRRWFSHDPSKWDGFRARYADEVAGHRLIVELRDIARNERLTLLYSARDTEHNQAVALAEIIARD